MKRALIAATIAAALIGGGVTSATWAGAPGESAQVTIVHAATYDAGEEFPVTVCVGGNSVDTDFRVGETIGPVTLPVGTITADVFVGSNPDCAGEPAISADLPLANGDDVIVAAVWNSNGPSLIAFPNWDRSCVEPGNVRVAAVHAATAGTVDVWAGPAGGDLAPLIPNFAEGDAAGPLDVPAGTYDIAVFPAGADPSGTPAIDLPGVELPEGALVQLYAIGGNDGDLGTFALVDELELCEPAPTTTVVETTTTTAPAQPQPPAAQPVSGNATYTG